MSALVVGEIVLAATLLVLVAALVLLVLRRRSLGTGTPLSLAAVRPEGTRWRLGLLRLGPTSLGWYPVVGLTTRPAYEWDRTHLEVSTPHPESVTVPGLSDPVRVDLACAQGRACALAVEPAVYIAIRSWLESAPPGRDVNVA